MITTAAIFTYLSRVNRSLHAFLSTDAKEMNEMNFVHIFDVYSTVVYRFGRNGSRLDVTAVISYNNGCNGESSHPIKRILRYHVNI